MSDTIANTSVRDVELRQAFRKYESGIALGNARRAAVFAAVFMLAGSSLDWVMLTDKAQEFLVIRSICVLLVGIIYWYLGRDHNVQLASLVSQGIAFFPTVSICIFIALTDGGNSPYYAGLNLVLVGLSLLLRWNFRNSLGMIMMTFFCYTLSVLFSPVSPEFRTLFGNCFFLFVTSVFVLGGSYFYERLRFSEFCLRAEVEQSRELLESQNRKLSELDKAKTRFFANISHELRTPLTIMLGITERLSGYLGSQSLDPTVSEMTQMLEQNGLRLLKLIDDLLDLVRFDTGHADVSRQSTQIQPHIDGLLRSLRHLAEQDNVALLWVCRTEHEAIMLDRDKFDKILLNLVINAIKFTPSCGTIDVKVFVSNRLLHLIVEDTGVGIPQEVLPRIFERFWQVDTSSTRKFQGAGIGLSLVRSLTEAMDGTVKVKSQIGQGSAFTVELPIVPTTIQHEQEPSSHSLQDGGSIANLHRRAALSVPVKMGIHSTQHIHEGELIDPSLKDRRPASARPLVMIADDEPDIRRFLKMQMGDVDVIEASDGAEAFKLACEHRPQLALLDFMMPEMNGVQVCKSIRDNHSTSGMAVIILTARADEQTKLAALRAGANDFLTKPFSTAELELRLENQIIMARVRREMADLNQELQAALEQIKENEVLMLRHEKLSALGRMSAGIIHEINNPLNYAGAGIHALETFTKALPDNNQADFADILKDIRDGFERVSQIVIDLRKLTHDNSITSGDADLVEIATLARRMVSHRIGHDIIFNLTTPENAVIRGNSNQLVQVFINLFQNSLDAIHQRISADGGKQGQIDVSIESTGAGWQVYVRDNGIGIPPEDLQSIFDPFFTSKDVGKGMGLGLSITHQILEAHKAHVDVESRIGEFTYFSILFPNTDYGEDTESVID